MRLGYLRTTSSGSERHSPETLGDTGRVLPDIFLQVLPAGVFGLTTSLHDCSVVVGVEFVPLMPEINRFEVTEVGKSELRELMRWQ